MQETTVMLRMTLSEINALARVVADWAEVAGEDDGINEGPLRAAYFKLLAALGPTERAPGALKLSTPSPDRDLRAIVRKMFGYVYLGKRI